MSHHTPEQVQKAFSKAPEILKQLQEAGVEFARFELYGDASGRLVLGPSNSVTGDQLILSSELVCSQRYFVNENEVGINFCCGLVSAAEKG